MPRKLIITAVAVLVVLGFIWTCYSLLSAEVKQGNVYEPYSTFRTAPSGTRVLFDSLSESGKTPKRNVFPLIHLFKEPPHTLVLFGISDSEMYRLPKDVVTGLANFVRKGGHLVLSLPSNLKVAEDGDADSSDESETPSNSSDDGSTSDNQPKTDHQPAKDENSISQKEYEKRIDKENRDFVKKQTGTDPEGDSPFVPSLLGQFGFGVEADSSQDPKDTFPDKLPPGAEESLPWRSSFYFVRLDPEWDVLYRIEHRPVAISRSFEKGRVTVLSDSYIFTNEALRNDRRVGFLTWTLGDDENPVFDETHLGVESERGIASVISSLGFEGYIVGALAVFLLYVWRNSCPLQPIQSDESMSATKGAEGAVAGRDARSGLVNLLRRNIPERNLVQVCLAEWKRSQTHGDLASSPKIRASEEIAQRLPASEVELLDSYNKISAVLSERKFLSKTSVTLDPKNP